MQPQAETTTTKNSHKTD